MCSVYDELIVVFSVKWSLLSLTLIAIAVGNHERIGVA